MIKDIYSMRAFIAIDVEFNEKMEKIYNELEKTGAKLKFVEPHNVHLTIKFLGEIDERLIPKIKQEMEKAIADIKPFQAKLKGLGVFPNENHIRVIWVGFDDEGQSKKMAEEIEKGLMKYGFKREKSFKPHVTIARMKSREGKEKVLEIIKKYKNEEFGEIECKELRLKQSILKPEGPIYKTIEAVKL